MSMQLFSPAFDNGGRIPDRYTKTGANEQPELIIAGVPEEAQELAVICHDPDAPMPNGFTHWLLYGIPAGTEQIPMNGEKQFRPAVNDFGDIGWGGPLPPEGHGPHHYYFWHYALDRPVSGMPDRETFLLDYGARVIDQSRIIGLYER
ncbi:YbhB/YbcL family Raf kinase inhibitor-like protein [Lamprobacter modestohalophilus]|uniref:YbhB/YbcL family Raf kinase inhibitor-like protein n=1 Tax=Lamprobacter modestohalophilus TaxID=1064514 RepID=UPI002ADED574|nr:YbhB/YbcL family Raf kinase inhibitor-like protein [Lamprobacter modestohalophilus]MEA1053182.1 YbhB/YbcL family Raf kinase inhibitor-like protein [Lamprobacter modestohalophilus]